MLGGILTKSGVEASTGMNKQDACKTSPYERNAQTPAKMCLNSAICMRQRFLTHTSPIVQTSKNREKQQKEEQKQEIAPKSIECSQNTLEPAESSKWRLFVLETTLGQMMMRFSKKKALCFHEIKAERRYAGTPTIKCVQKPPCDQQKRKIPLICSRHHCRRDYYDVIWEKNAAL